MDTVSLTGIGAGAGSSIFGFLTRSTRPEERAGIFAAIMACRQAGLLVGQFLPCTEYTVKRERCHFPLTPFLLTKKIRRKDFVMSSLMFLLSCEEKEAFNKITKV